MQHVRQVYCIILEPGVQDDAEEPPFISSPGCGEHSTGQVEERTVNPRSIGQVHPHISQLFGHKEPMSPIVCMDHGHRVPQPVGHLLQAQLQTPIRVLPDNAKVSI